MLKQIIDFPNYSVTRSGIVINTKFNRILQQHDNEKGYLYVRLRKNNKTINKYVHILVAKHFVPNPYGKPEVNHIDTIKTNNDYENLEWTDRLGNMKHAKENGLIPYGENKVNSKLTNLQVRIVRATPPDSYINKLFAQAFNTTERHIRKIRNRKRRCRE